MVGVVLQRHLGVNGDIFVGAAQGGGEDCGAGLDKAAMDGATGAGERVESGEVEVGHDAGDDALGRFRFSIFFPRIEGSISVKTL